MAARLPNTMNNQSGERQLQQKMGTEERAERFYTRHLHTELIPRMIDLIRRQEMVFIATSDGEGNCDSSPRFGSAGFVQVLTSKMLAYPEFRGNGVYASLGNIIENPHIGMVFVDFFDSTVGLHVNGKAISYLPVELPEDVLHHLKPSNEEKTRAIERWVIISIDEAYIHCSKHVPKLQKLGKAIDWGTDDPHAKAT